MTLFLCNRRSFLRFSLSTAALSAVHAPLSWASGASRMPVGRLNLTNLHTGEKISTAFRDSTGEYDKEGLDAINRLLRCHYTDQIHEIDVHTIEFIHQVDLEFGGDREILIISGYRSPTYNELLRQQGHRVASQSLHLIGRAVDIRIPGVPLKAIRQAAIALQGGGVGYYPRSGFVHLDSGDIRTW